MPCGIITQKCAVFEIDSRCNLTYALRVRGPRCKYSVRTYDFISTLSF